MQEPSIASAYYQQALSDEKQYKESLPLFWQEEKKYEQQLQAVHEEDNYGYHGSGRTVPDNSAYHAAKLNKEKAYLRLCDNLKNAFQHGSTEAALKMIEYSLKLETKGPIQFGLQDKEQIAASLYAKAQELKASYQSVKQKEDEAWGRYNAECTKAAEEDAYGYYGANATRPNSSGFSELDKTVDQAKNRYFSALREAAKYGSNSATQDLIKMGQPLGEPESCLIM
jgi:hypothetical protein